MYFRAFKKWKDFAVGKLNISFLPANSIHVALYLQHILDSTRSCSSVNAAFYAFKWAHETADLVSETYNPIISKIGEAAKRIESIGRPNRKEPLPAEVLKKIARGCGFNK